MDNYHPARKISNRSGFSKVIGFFSSQKMNTLISWESQLERDFCYLIEYDKKIVKYLSQPQTFIFNYNGKKIRYTPDFYLEYEDGTTAYIEIKYYESLRKPKIANKLEILKNYFKFQNINYQIIFDSEIRVQPKLNNIKFLHRYSRIPFENTFKIEFEGTLKELSKNFDIKNIYAAMYKNFINFDINQKISENTILSIRIKK